MKMKRYILFPFLAAAIAAQAQDTYMNERLINSSSDVIGTARYVGMGGALGALGADMSVISWNPAGIGLYRKNDLAITFGGHWGKSSIQEESRGAGTFDQGGIVINFKTGGETCPYFNFAFNYQKKINFNHNFYADNPNLGGLSQMDQVAELTQFDEDWQNNLAGMAMQIDADAEKKGNDRIYFKKDSNGDLYNDISSSRNEYTHHSEGALHAFDLNLSTNINDRVFLGLTVGIDNMRYRGWTYYREYNMEDNASYDLNRDVQVTGTGVNVKLGTIVRPIADNPLRFALVVETPTWYKLKNSTLFDLRPGIESDPWESRLKFNLRSPWKVRTGIGSTIGSSFAWDVDYEFAAYAGTSQGYPKNEYWNGSTSGNTKDVAMNDFTRNTLRGTHTLRIGLEANATKNLAFRLGYNLSTSAYKKDISFDQYNINSAAMDYATSTSYMRLGNTNILSLGMGYRAKKFYIDLVYKLRNQKADFYAFDTNFTNSVSGDPVFLRQNQINGTDLADRSIDPVDVNLTRQAITCTLGFKF